MSERQPYIKKHYVDEETGDIYVNIIDPITGEIVRSKRLETLELDPDEKAIVIKKGKRKKADPNPDDLTTDDATGRQPYFVKLYLTNYRHIVRNLKLSHGGWALLAKIMPFISFESNYLVHPDIKVDGEYAKPMNCRELARVINESPSFVSRCMGELRDAGVIRVIKGKTNDFYIVNPHVLFRGGNEIKEIEQVYIFDDEEDALELPIKVRYKQKSLPNEDDLIA